MTFDYDKIFEQALSINATSKTRKYVLDSKDVALTIDGVDYNFKQLLSEWMSETTKAIRSAKLTKNVIAHDGYQYSINDYSFPLKVVQFINTNYVYLNSMAVLSAEPVYVAASKVNAKKTLTPLEVQLFYSRYNEQQAGSEIALTPVSTTDVTLEEVSIVTDGTGNYYATSNGYSSNFIGHLAQVTVDPSLAKFMRKISPPNDLEVARWLFTM